MTIKEIEILTGLPRTNIRYYEQEGLISPQRSENRYRDYSQEDVQTLLRVRLLRSLDLPLEEIKDLLRGGDLASTLRRHLNYLEEKEHSIDRAKALTVLLIEKEEAFATLDAAAYLNAQDTPRETEAKKLNLPWRRYWAWGTDAMIFSFLTNLVLEPRGVSGWFLTLLQLLAILFGTSVCLHFFATTPGKAIFGIRVLNLEGERLSFWDALERNWICLWEGQGLRLPLVSYYFMYKSYMAADTEPLPWELDSELTFRDDKNWRYILWVLVELGICGCAVLSVLKEGGFL